MLITIANNNSKRRRNHVVCPKERSFLCQSVPRLKASACRHWLSTAWTRYATQTCCIWVLVLNKPIFSIIFLLSILQVEIRGLSERGIYRVSGSEKEIKALYDRYQKTDELPNLSRVDMHVICGCIKNFLRNLREPLIPTYQWIAFSNAVVNHVDDSINGEIQKAIQLEIELLPKANRETLAFLVLHLKR